MLVLAVTIRLSEKSISRFVCFFVFFWKDFIYLREIEREHEWGAEGEPDSPPPPARPEQGARLGARFQDPPGS